MTLPVYVDPDLSAACVGETIRLDGDEARHAATVRRTRVGERIDIVNGKGLRATITVTDVAKSSLVGTVEHVANDPAHNPQITLVQALAKGGRDEQAVETATEYGADAFIPWQAERSIVSWSDPAKARKGVGRWEATAQSAAKQSRRSGFLLWISRTLARLWLAISPIVVPMAAWSTSAMKAPPRRSRRNWIAPAAR